MQSQRPLIYRFVVLVLCIMVAVMTMQGAYDLTGKALLAIVLGSCVFVQWMAARWAVEHFMKAWTQPGRRLAHGGASLFGFALWFLPAMFTVSLLAAEMNIVMSAQDVGASRFQAEQQRVQQRANAVVGNLDAVQSGLAAFATHASAMALKERSTGSSCMAATGKGPGPVKEFREADNNFANSLSTQVSAPLATMKAQLAAVDKMRFAPGDVALLQADLQQKVERLNATRGNPMLASIRDAAAQRIKDAERIEYFGAIFHCEDPSRSALLRQVVLAVDNLAKLPLLEPVILMDPKNSRSIATASLLGTWSAVTSVMPEKLRVPLSPDLARQHGIGEGPLELKPSNMGNVLAWGIEFMLLAALFAGSNGSGGGGLSPVGRLLLGKLRERASFLGELVEAALQPDSRKSADTRLYADADVILPDGDLQGRVRSLFRHYRPYGDVDLLVVPLRDTAAMKAARELELLRLVSRKASALSREELTSDPRFAAVVDTMAPYEPGPFAVFRIISNDLARHVLTGGGAGAEGRGTPRAASA